MYRTLHRWDRTLVKRGKCYGEKKSPDECLIHCSSFDKVKAVLCREILPLECMTIRKRTDITGSTTSTGEKLL